MLTNGTEEISSLILVLVISDQSAVNTAVGPHPSPGLSNAIIVAAKGNRFIIKYDTILVRHHKGIFMFLDWFSFNSNLLADFPMEVIVHIVVSVCVVAIC